MPCLEPETIALLRLTLTPGLGPVLISRGLEKFGSAAAMLAVPAAGLAQIKGVSSAAAVRIVGDLAASERLADDELALAERLGVQILGRHEPDYPALLRPVPSAPPILYIRGRLEADGLDRYPVAIVGSRSCTQYGLEQAARFAAGLGQAGLTIISGGARGIDTAAHQSALRVRARTVAVLGCGLNDCYPPDNRAMFDQIVSEGLGAIVSELPLNTPPNAENFPARNRIISGLSLGVLVIEAGRRSGALITARVAVEDQGREVFALPSRVDSSASQGSLDLLKSGSAAMVTHPDDILAALESPARHQFGGTHEARFAPTFSPAAPDPEPAPLFGPTPAPSAATRETGPRDAGLSDAQRRILGALDEPRSLDQLAAATGLAPATLRADLTMLEIRRRVKRAGTLIARAE